MTQDSCSTNLGGMDGVLSIEYCAERLCSLVWVYGERKQCNAHRMVGHPTTVQERDSFCVLCLSDKRVYCPRTGLGSNCRSLPKPLEVSGLHYAAQVAIYRLDDMRLIAARRPVH